MLILSNNNIALFCGEDGKQFTLEDKIRGEKWILDEKTLVYGDVDNSRGASAALNPLTIERAEKKDETLLLHMQAAGHGFALKFLLNEEYIEITLPALNYKHIGVVSVPGAFRAAEGKEKYILPVMQGMWWDGRGNARELRFFEAGHFGFVMPMFGTMGSKGALLTIAETYDDCLWWVGKEESGRTWVSNLQVDSLGTMRYERKVRIYPADNTITRVAKKYRSYVQAQGRFVNWEEKIKERPALSRLFGSIMCFIGYCQDDLDYAAECKKLKDYGFDKALLYPLRFNTYSQDFKMGGYDPIWLDRGCVDKIKGLGYDVAPWSWINEGIDDGSADMKGRFRVKRDATMSMSWQIDEHKWFNCCTTQMEAFLRHQNATDFNDMTWDHFDVIACATNNECHALDHPAHMGRPLSKTEDRQAIRALFEAAKENNKIVSSENFNDAYSLEYDLGSVKAWPQFGPWPFWPIPLTGLVYHDSILHSWWEPHNYNMRYFDRDMMGLYQYGGGRARLMASMDALYGCPPDVFPFGAMYGWEGNGSKTILYKSRFEDTETQFALEQALPVARHHERIGKLEMTDFSFETEDGTLQKTTFADGTIVYANLGTQGARFAEEVGGLQSESWKAIYPE